MSERNDTIQSALPDLIEHIPAVAFRRSLEAGRWRTWFVNGKISMYGYRQEEFLSGERSWLDLVYPDDRIHLQQAMDDYAARLAGRFRLYYRLVKADGSMLPVIDHCTVNRGEDGKIVCYDSLIVGGIQEGQNQRMISDHIHQQVVLNEILMGLHQSSPRQAIQLILDRVGRYLDISRALLFRDFPDGERCELIYEWCNEGISSLRAISPTIHYADSLPHIRQMLDNARHVLLQPGSIPPGCEGELQREGVTAAALFAVYRGGKRYGFLSFDECVMAERSWDDATARFLKNISDFVSTALDRQLAAEVLEQNRQTYQAVIDNIDSFILVTEPDTHRIIFANRTFRHAFGSDVLDQPASRYLALPQEETGVREQFNEVLGEWLTVQSEEITWIDGRPVLLTNCYNTTAGRLYADAMENLAYQDHLTGLPNRYRCELDLEGALRDARATNRAGYFLFIDLDDFKIINDTFGHDYGDAMLVTFAQYLEDAFPPPHQVFRFGGDEFVVLVSHQAPPDIHGRLEVLLRRAEQPWKAMGREFFCTLSIGVVRYPGTELSSGAVITHADIAMYEAKRRGKNSYEFYMKRLDGGTLQRSQTEELLRRSMDNGFEGFRICYQPVFGVEWGRITSAEALLRMVHGDTVIPPHEFLPLANYLGFVIPIGEHVLREAARECRSIVEAGHRDFIMTVNLASRQIGQKDIVERIIAILQEEGVAARNFAIALSEEEIREDVERMNQVAAALRRAGLTVRLTDFGSGSASIVHLPDLEVDQIKTSPQLMARFQDPYFREFIQLITRLCHSIDKGVCLGGIENEEQLWFARECGADALQGFYLQAGEPPGGLLRHMGVQWTPPAGLPPLD